MGNPLLAGVSKEHAKTEDSMTRGIYQSTGSESLFLHVLNLILEDHYAKDKFQ